MARPPCCAPRSRRARCEPGQDFFPLTVNYQEKTFAAGKIPGGFFKREGRPAEKETLTSRLIDRPIRPLFPDGFKNETQVICTVLAHDQENDPDIVAMIGASAALTISGIPFLGPIAGARVGYKDGEFLLNPTYQELAGSELDLVVAGTRDAVMMVEFEAKELPEETMLAAVLFGQEQFQPVIDAIIELAEACAKEPWELQLEDHSELYDQLGRGLRGGSAARPMPSRPSRPATSWSRRSRRRRSRPRRRGRRATRRRARRSSRSSRRRSCATRSSTPGGASTAATPRPCGRSRSRSACCRACTAAPCSPAARPRRWWSRRSAPARTSR